MSRYAEGTAVSSDKSKAEIEHTLRRYGATAFMSGWDAGRAVIGFEMEGRRIRFTLPMPDRQAREFTHTPGRNLERHRDDQERAYEQAVRQRWRALALVLKAKLEAVAAGITVFEDEFLSHIVLPSGETVGQWLKPQIHLAYETKTMPPMLPDYSERAGDAAT